MEDRKSPAGRLLEILSLAKTKPTHLSTMEVWASVFGCDVASTQGIVYGFAEILQLCKDGRTLTERLISGDRTIFLAPYEKIEGVLTLQHLGHPWASYREQFDSGIMTALEFGDHALSLAFSAGPPELPQQIRDFVSKLDTLLEECPRCQASCRLS